MRSRLAGLALLAHLLLPTAALAAPGDVDTSFGTNGTSSPDLGPRTGLVAGDRAPDGSLIVAGTQINDATGPDVVVASIRPDGKGLNTAFGGGKGYITITPTPEKVPDSVVGVDVASDGTIYVGGYTFEGGTPRLFAAAVDPFGDLMTGFGAGGIRLIDIAGTSVESAGNFALDPSGRPVLSGNDDTDFLVVRLDPKTGAYDASFDGDGIVRGTGVAGAPDTGQGLAISADAIYVGGLSGGSIGDAAVVRIGHSGQFDPAFGADTTPGVATFRLGDKSQRLNALAVSDAGVGVAGAGSDVEGGALQPAFGTLTPDGQVRYMRQMGMPFPAGEVRGLLMDQMGGLLGSGSTSASGDGDFFSFSANSDGTPNTAFGDGGSRVYPDPNDTFGGRMIFDIERGRYVVVGDAFTPTVQIPTLFAIKLADPPPRCRGDAVIESVRFLGAGTFGDLDFWGTGDGDASILGGRKYRLEVVYANKGPDHLSIITEVRRVRALSEDDVVTDVEEVPAGQRRTFVRQYSVGAGSPTSFLARVTLTHQCDEIAEGDNKRERSFDVLDEDRMTIESRTDLLLGEPSTLRITNAGARSSATRVQPRRVHIALLRRTRGVRPAARRCQWLASSKARFAARRAKRRRCTRPLWLPAKRKGRAWTFRLRRGLPRGRYVLYARRTYKGGAKTLVFNRRRGNRGTFTVDPPG